MKQKCTYNELTGEEPALNDCSKCEVKYNFPYRSCCLLECGEHEFCKACQHGIYEIGNESSS